MGDVSQESGEPRLQFTISFCAVRRSKACSDSNDAVERGAIAVKQWSDSNEAVERQQWSSGATAVKGDRVAPCVNHAVAIQGDKVQLMSCTLTL